MGGLIGAFSPGSAERVAGDPEALSEPEAFRGERISWSGPGGHVTAYRWPWEPVPLAFDSRCVVALQGELFVERGTQGAPWLLDRFRRLGAASLHGLDGEFAGLVWDIASGALLLFRDAFATRPLFFSVVGRTVGVGTEIRQAARAAGIPLRADPRLVAREAKGLQTEGRRTLWLDVSRVLPSEALRIYAGGSSNRVVWPFPAVPPRRLEAAAVARDLPETLRKAVFRRGGRQILLLSGGLDSTSIAAAAPDRFKGALTLSYPGYDCDDAERAASVARMHGIRHEILDITAWGPVRCLAETMRDCDQLPGMTAYQVRPAMERVRSMGGEVGALGFGGDEFFLPAAQALADVLVRDGPVAALRAVADLVRDGETAKVPARAFARRVLRSVALPVLQHALSPAFDTGERQPLLSDFDPRGDHETWRGVSVGWWRTLAALAEEWSGPANEVLEQLAARTGVGLAFPFLDRTVAVLALSAWSDAVMGLRRRKELLAATFRGRLPSQITEGWRGLMAPVPVEAEILEARRGRGPGHEGAPADPMRGWDRLRLEYFLAGRRG